MRLSATSSSHSWRRQAKTPSITRSPSWTKNLNDIEPSASGAEAHSAGGIARTGVLCLAYLKSNVYGNEFKSKKECRNAMLNSKFRLHTIPESELARSLTTNSIKAEILYTLNPYGNKDHWTADGKLQHNIQIRNIPQRDLPAFMEMKEKTTW